MMQCVIYILGKIKDGGWLNDYKTNALHSWRGTRQRNRGSSSTLQRGAVTSLLLSLPGRTTSWWRPALLDSPPTTWQYGFQWIAHLALTSGAHGSRYPRWYLSAVPLLPNAELARFGGISFRRASLEPLQMHCSLPPQDQCCSLMSRQLQWNSWVYESLRDVVQNLWTYPDTPT